MEAAFYLLLIIGHLGVFDVLYFHQYKCDLMNRPECQKEVFWHTLRHLAYGLQFIFIAHFTFYGWALLFLAFTYFLDVTVAVSDVWEETHSRAKQGGLPQGEYLMHIILSVLVGAYICLVISHNISNWAKPSAVLLEGPNVPWILKIYMSFMALGAFVSLIKDGWQWFKNKKKFQGEYI